MEQNERLRITLLALWLLLVAAVIGALATQDRFFATSARAIALLGAKAGSVQVRTEGLVRWRDAVERQGLFDGDRIATGNGARAKIAFGSECALLLGENAQLHLTTITRADKADSFVITLVRGRIIASVEKDGVKCTSLMIRAGRDTYSVLPGEKVGVSRAQGERAQTFVPKSARARQEPAPPP